MATPFRGETPPRQGERVPLDRRAAEDIARGLRALADPTRLQILSIIVASDGRESTVSELAERLGLRQPTISHHLAILAADGLLLRDQRGKHAWFRVDPRRAREVDDLLL